MPSLNRATLIGHVGKDPEIRYSASGNAVANLSIATTESWKDKATGEKKEQTEWHRLVFFGRLAEIVESYVKKGDPIYVEGSIRTRKWTDKEGVERYSTEINCNELKMLGGRDRSQASEPRAPTTTVRPVDLTEDDDIPF